MNVLFLVGIAFILGATVGNYFLFNALYHLVAPNPNNTAMHIAGVIIGLIICVIFGGALLWFGVIFILTGVD